MSKVEAEFLYLVDTGEPRSPSSPDQATVHPNAVAPASRTGFGFRMLARSRSNTGSGRVRAPTASRRDGELLRRRGSRGTLLPGNGMRRRFRHRCSDKLVHGESAPRRLVVRPPSWRTSPVDSRSSRESRRATPETLLVIPLVRGNPPAKPITDAAFGGPVKCSLHSAFDDPGTPVGAATRESIEVRVMAFW